MIKKTLTYVDLDGNPVTEDFYFHISAAELIEWESSRDGGMISFIERIVAESNAGAIMDEFKNLILMSVGERSEDGRSFKKDPNFVNGFKWSVAFDALFMELATSTDSAVEFVRGVLPANIDQLGAQVAQAAEAAKTDPPTTQVPPKPITL